MSAAAFALEQADAAHERGDAESENFWLWLALDAVENGE